MQTTTQVLEETSEFYNLSPDELFNIYSVSPENGLSEEQVQNSLAAHGRNELKKVKKSFYNVFITPIVNLLIIIYLASALAMWVLGEIQRTVPTFVIVGFNAIVAIVQQFRAEKQLQALKKLSEASAKIIRDGKLIKLSTSEVVVGDIVKLSQGDKVPADCRIIFAGNLTVDESNLTGESQPVKKSSTGKKLIGLSLPIQDQTNMVFLGTFVSSGECTALVVRIGEETEIGMISTKLEESTTNDIPLRKKMNLIAKFLGIGVLILIIISISWKSSILIQANNFSWNNFRLALIDSIDLGMKVMPINLPLLTTIVLLTGVLAMAKKGVIVRDISSTESLGRVSIVCSDKTGTLTQNQMTVINIWTPTKEFEVSGLGYSPKGKVHYPWNPSEEAIEKDLEQLILSGYLNNNAQILQKSVKILAKKKQKKVWTISGLPTEAALKVLAKKYGSNIEKKAEQYKLIHEFNFDSKYKRMSQIYRYTPDKSLILFAKGATEWILPLCTHIQKDGEVSEITEESKQNILTNMQKYAEQGLRILSITYRNLQKGELSKDLESETAREETEKNLIYLGFVVIFDPPRKSVENSIQECKEAGITPIMITGDNLITATAIAKSLGIYDENINKAVEGNDINALSDRDFHRVSVYSRVSPEHKQKIVDRYQKEGKIVSMSGDGVNDALALSMADCGVAMGIQGTEVAKEAADMVITDDSFNTIVTGIREGRGLFEKIRTILYFFVCVSVMEAIILFSSTLNFNNPNFAMWDYYQLNILYVTAHMFPSLGFTFGSYSKHLMEEKPRDSAEILTKPIMKIMLIHMICIGFAIVLVYYGCLWGIIPVDNSINQNIGFNAGEVVPNAQIKARTMGFIIIFILESFILPIQIRRLNYSAKDSLKDIKWTEFLFYLPALLILIFAVYSLPFQELMGKMGWNLNFMFLNVTDWIICLLLSAPAFLLFELIRKKARRRHIVF